MFNLCTTFASIFPFRSSGIYSQFRKISAGALRLSFLVGSIAIYVLGRRVVDNYLYIEKMNNLSQRIREIRKENEELKKQNIEIVDQVKGKFQKVINDSSKEHKEQIQQIVDHYESKLKNSD